MTGNRAVMINSRSLLNSTVDFCLEKNASQLIGNIHHGHLIFVKLHCIIRCSNLLGIIIASIEVFDYG